MKTTILPILSATAVISSRNTVFRGMHLDHVVTIEAPRQLMEVITTICDGKHTFEQVVEFLKSDWDELSVRGLLNELLLQCVLVDGRSIVEQSWSLVENPIGSPGSLDNKAKAHLVRKAYLRQRKDPVANLYSVAFTGYGDLLNRRRSHRLFSGDVDMQKIVNMLWSGYGEIADGRRTVPSAGALYPLCVHVVFFKKTADLVPGVYRVYLGSPGAVGFSLVSEDTNRFARSFIDPLMLEKAHGAIVISGSFDLNGEKYGTRSMLFVPLEAGHVAQNIHLSATEQGVATVEVGGFKEHFIAEAISLPKSHHPLITVLFGHEDQTAVIEPVNHNIEIQWAQPTTKRYRPPFAIVSARMVGRKSWSNGRDVYPRLAYTKAVSEAKEWASCGCVSESLVHTSFKGLPSAIHPKEIMAFHPEQYQRERFPFKPLDEAGEYGWVEGCNEVSGEMSYILADLVYFPYFPKTPYYAYANSSGVAAHPSREQAVQTSTLELVERDSFMIAYLTRLEFPTVSELTLPQSIKVRIRELRKAGFRVWIKDHSLDLAPVVCVLAQSEEHGCTTCASCSSFDVEHAVDHALMEVEAFVLARLQNGKSKSIRPDEVIMPLDHGKLYDQGRYFHRADFLIRARNKIRFQGIGEGVAHSWLELLERFRQKKWQLITIPLHLSEKQGGNGDLHIVRSIVPGMVPMTFGYQQEPAGMPRIYDIARRFGGRELSYKGLTKFPHPFE